MSEVAIKITPALVAPSQSETDLEQALFLVAEEVHAEIEKADANWPGYNSAHEALGVLREEYVEFEKIVFQKQKDRDLAHMRKELIQIAAVAMRAARDVCTEEVGRK